MGNRVYGGSLRLERTGETAHKVALWRVVVVEPRRGGEADVALVPLAPTYDYVPLTSGQIGVP